MTGNEVSAEVGGYILNNMPNLTVDVHEPEVKLMVELRIMLIFIANLFMALVVCHMVHQAELLYLCQAV